MGRKASEMTPEQLENRRRNQREWRRRTGNTSMAVTKNHQQKQIDVYIKMMDWPEFEELIVTQEQKWRTCLKCSKQFKSAGKGNRICGTCAVSNRKVPKLGTEIYSTEAI